MNILSNTNYGRKSLFSKILSNELDVCSFKINAVYDSAPPEQVMTAQITDNQVIRLGINTSFKAENLFSDCSDPLGMSIAYRSYFIINYIHCLATAKEANTNSFFPGLVVFESICDLTFGKKNVFTIPNIYTKNKNLRPIDVHCAIRAITRVVIENSSIFSDETKKKCELYTNTLIAYTRLPEIEYKRSKYSQYTILNETKALKELISKNSEIVYKYALFHKYAIVSLDKLNIDELLSACDINKDNFWPGMILRILAITKDNKKLKEYLKHPSLETSYLDFCRNSMEYYSEINEQSLLLRENWQAIQQLVIGLQKQTAPNVYSKKGMVHFIQ